MVLCLNCPKEPPSMLLFLRIKILHSILKIPGDVRPYWAILLCHKINEEIVQSFLDASTEKCQGLWIYCRSLVVMAKSLINTGCATFPAAVMLLRSNHAKQNIKESLKDLVGNIELRKTEYTLIFGNEFKIALVYSDNLKVFDLRLQHLSKRWEVNPKLQSFCQ